MTQRDSAPALAPLTAPALLPYKRFSLPNGIDIVYIHDPAQEVFKIDAVFEAGIYYQPKPLIASTAINMLNGGTARHTAEEKLFGDFLKWYEEIHPRKEKQKRQDLQRKSHKISQE